MKVLVLNGPNLNHLKERDSAHYGSFDLAEVEERTKKNAMQYRQFENLQMDWKQSSLEGELVDWIHQVRESSYDALIINPGGYAHTSVAIHDALELVSVPCVEVHLSQLFQREEFRQKLVTAKSCDVVMTGAQDFGYFLALFWIGEKLSDSERS